MDNIKILWADDEIDLLKPQIMFLENKGYEVITVSNGHDAIEECESYKDIQVVFLDESMPGMSGLDALVKIKEISPHLPVVMITKNEAETVMEEAIGSQISDYLIKPVNPNQILLTLKRLIDNKRLVRERTSMDYQQEFRKLFMEINSGLNYEQWVEMYKKIIHWELRLDDSQTTQMADILSMQKSEANAEFSKFISNNYLDWLDTKNEAPLLSHEVMRKFVFPELRDDIPTVFLVLDNLRYDQWKIIEPILSENFRMEFEDSFYSLLPTSTQYSRNALFAGLTPLDIQAYYPEMWKNDNEEGGKNLFEKELLSEQIRRSFRKEIKFDYTKITTIAAAKQLQDTILDQMHNHLYVIVYNFIDMMSHARTEMEVLKELAGDETAYRSLTRSWFLNSPLWKALQTISEREVQLIVTTDHGTIRVKQPNKVIGDRETTTNLRYKVGKNLNYDKKTVFEIKDPKKAGLPSPNMSSAYIFAKEDSYFLYPNNYNYYNNYYFNTFQHGGISLEEMICPIVKMVSK
jgi:CheY-like chemotaxis protein